MGGAVRNGQQLLGERYRLIEQLGAGGMSVVWRGYDEVLGRQVAVKVLASRLASDKAFRHRIRIEAQAAARLCHPNITNVYDYGESEQVGLTVPYVVMELVDGGPLSSRLGRGGQLPWREAVTIGAEVASALATAHARGVVHRDVTPGNVMLTPTGVKVVDFGISALVGESEQGPDGALLGTPAYLAPERLDNGQVSPATDVYAVGLLLYRMLTGRLPWQASTTTQMLRAHMYNDPDPMPPVVGLPAEVEELVRRCLAKSPADRPSTADVARTLADAAGIAAIVPVSPALGQFDPALLENAGTTILPWSTATDALPFSAVRTRTRRAAARRRKVEAGVAAVGLVAVTAAMWGMTSRRLGQRRGRAHGGPDGAAPAGAVRGRLRAAPRLRPRLRRRADPDQHRRSGAAGLEHELHLPRPADGDAGPACGAAGRADGAAAAARHGRRAGAGGVEEGHVERQLHRNQPAAGRVQGRREHLRRAGCRGCRVDARHAADDQGAREDHREGRRRRECAGEGGQAQQGQGRRQGKRKVTERKGGGHGGKGKGKGK